MKARPSRLTAAAATRGPFAAWLARIAGVAVLAGLAAAEPAAAHPASRQQTGGPPPGAQQAAGDAAGFIEERPILWSLAVPDSAALTSGAAELVLSATVEEGWYLYALTQPEGGPQPLDIALAGAGVLRVAGEIGSPRPRTYPDVTFNLFTAIHREDVSFILPVEVQAGARGTHAVAAHVTYQTCNSRYCLPPRTDTVAAEVDFGGLALIANVPPSAPERGAAEAGSPSAEAGSPSAEAGSPSAEAASMVLVTVAEPAAESAPFPAPATLESPAAAGAETAPAGWAVFGRQQSSAAPDGTASALAFLWLAFLMGLASLLTPCVFPMVPLTVAYFGRSGAGAGAPPRSRLRDAAFFVAGIVLTFTAAGLLVTFAFGAGGVVRLAASPWMNLAIAALFGVFALNLLGLFEVRLPTRLLTGASRVGDSGSAAGAGLMGGAFAVTSFTCTAPFVGTLLVLATQGSWRWPLLGMVVFAGAFALPFFLLALAPGALSRLPRGGPWLTDLRRALGVLEAAAAVKFLSNVDLVLGWGVLTRDVVIGIWAAALLVVGGLLLARHVSAPPRIAAAALCLAASLWMARGLQGYRLGELEAFLPPPPHGVLLASGAGELPWRLNDYEGSLRLAQSGGRPLLVDFTGYTCTNCRWMEANMFPRGEVRALLGQYVRLRLYTDGQGPTYAEQQAFQARTFGTVALPYYAILDPDGRPLATFLGMTRDEREFVRFLEAGLATHHSPDLER